MRRVEIWHFRRLDRVCGTTMIVYRWSAILLASSLNEISFLWLRLQSPARRSSIAYLPEPPIFEERHATTGNGIVSTRNDAKEKAPIQNKLGVT